MPILRSLPQWPNPQESIGRQIPSSRVGNRMVWWPRGPALEVFEKSIQPEIENILKVVELGHADLFIRLYMIGRRPESANPIVMICCTNSKARDAAETTIRESDLLVGYKGFGLGGAALPLEHPTLVRRLMLRIPCNSATSQTVTSSTSSIFSHASTCGGTFSGRVTFSSGSISEGYILYSKPLLLPTRGCQAIGIFAPFIIDKLPDSVEYNNSGLVISASSTDPSIGRRIFASTDVGHSSHPYATAGVVIQVGRKYYQLTVGHLFEANRESLAEEEMQTSLDECHFDGQSDYEERDSDRESEQTGRGSATPKDALSQSSSSTDEETTRDYNTNEHGDSSSIFEAQNKSRKILDRKRRKRAASTNSKTPDILHDTSSRLPIGCLPRGKSFQSLIDYAIINIPKSSIECSDSPINAISGPYLQVKNFAKVGHEEREVIIATHSCIKEGVLIPGRVSYRNCRAQFERLVQVKLENAILEGDSGSSVLDKSTGSLYGHIIMGVPGKKVAYMVQAVDVFRDIEAGLGKPISIVIRERSRLGFQSPCEFDGYGLPCEFARYGSCDQEFALDDADGWIEHIISVHLQGRLPKKVVCWYCDNWVFDYKNVGDRRINFESRMWHIRDHILGEGMTGHYMRPDHFFNDHLQKHGLVPEHTYIPGPNWILPHDVPPDWKDRDAREEYVVNDPIEERRKHHKHHKHRHKSGKSKK
ncbi:hypothetical protein F4680DRAFT_369192 [Xylaria scruposa]|nr:hypothetical protein F4680DRAFT_369192 [Xylaria scruposa]